MCYTFVIKLHRLYKTNTMNDILFQISACQKTQQFFAWAERLGYKFNYNIFGRTKNGIGKRRTDRQKLLIELAMKYCNEELDHKRVLDQEG